MGFTTKNQHKSSKLKQAICPVLAGYGQYKTAQKGDKIGLGYPKTRTNLVSLVLNSMKVQSLVQEFYTRTVQLDSWVRKMV